MRRLASLLALLALATPVLAQESDSIPDALKQPFTASFADTRLAVVVASIQERTKLNIVLATGVDLDMAVTVASSGQPLGQVFGQIERGHGLAHTVWCGAVVLHPAATPPGAEPTLPASAALDDRITLAFDAQPFMLAVERLRQRTKVTIEVTNRARAQVGVQATGITMRVNRMTAKHLLVHLARATNLGVTFDGDKATFDATRAGGEVDARTIEVDRTDAMSTSPDADIPRLLREVKVPVTRDPAKQALTRAGKPAAAAVAAALRDADPPTTSALLEVLSANGSDAQAQDVLVVFHDAQRSLDLRTAAGATLGKMKAVSAIPALIDALDDPWFRVAETARGALVGIGEPVVAPLQARYQPAAAAAPHHGIVYRSLLIFGSINSDRCKQILLAALGTTTGPRALALRHHAAIGLGFTADMKVVEPLIDALEREKQFLVATYIARSLGWITSQDLGPQAPRWRAWWAQNKKHLLEQRAPEYDDLHVPTGADGLPLLNDPPGGSGR